MATKSCLKVAPSFICKSCDYITSKKSSYDKHRLTSKHSNNEYDYKNATKSCSKDATNYNCNCGKIYLHHSSLWKHKKKCTQNIINEESDSPLDIITSLFKEQMKENKELKELLIEQNKNMLEIVKENKIITNNTINNTNSNNQFNLQFFLNETCKDALNIDEFVNQIQLQLSDLDMIGKVGYVEGITKIFLRNLKALDVCKRPIHCSDLKREVLYIKDKGSWEKDNDQNVKIKTVIKGIEDKNIKQLPQWRAENPTHEDTETKKHMEYVHILIESMGGTPIEDDNKRLEKIIRNIAKEVVIDKSK